MKQNIKKAYLCSLVALLLIAGQSIYNQCTSPKESTYNQEEIKRLQNIVRSYEAYYCSTEMLLDELGIVDGDTIFNTEVGYYYLEDKNYLDSIANKLWDDHYKGFRTLENNTTWHQQ